MNLKKNVWISSKSIFTWTCRKRWFSSKSNSLKLPNVNDNLESFKTLKYPESMFVHNNDVAKDISNTICKHLTKSYGNKQLTLIEVNPGPCLITKQFLKKTNYNILLYENSYKVFENFLTPIHSSYGDRISIEKGNFLLLWKLGFQDRLDAGDRVSKFLSKLKEPQPWNNESPSFQIIAALPNRKFLNYLTYSFMFQTGLMIYGRPEFYFLLPPSVFMKYNCKPIIDKKYYKTQSILFQTIFDIELLGKYPRNAFFPPHISKSESKNVRFKEANEEDEKYMILAKMVGRPNIFGNNGLTEDLLKPYWYFLKHHTISRENFVIPMLEQWIPGCGPHFIGQGHTIFTQFGDLTHHQILRIFLKFVSLPEFKDSSFLSSMEIRITKLLPSAVQIISYDSNVQQSTNNSTLDSEETNNKDH